MKTILAFGLVIQVLTVVLVATVADKYVETQRRQFIGMRSEGIDRRAVYFDSLTGAVLIGPTVEIE